MITTDLELEFGFLHTSSPKKHENWKATFRKNSVNSIKPSVCVRFIVGYMFLDLFQPELQFVHRGAYTKRNRHVFWDSLYLILIYSCSKEDILAKVWRIIKAEIQRIIQHNPYFCRIILHTLNGLSSTLKLDYPLYFSQIILYISARLSSKLQLVFLDTSGRLSFILQLNYPLYFSQIILLTSAKLSSILQLDYPPYINQSILHI